MLAELEINHFRQFQHLKKFSDRINKNLYKKNVYLFPANAYSKFLYKKLKTKKTFIVDNYLKKKCIRPSSIIEKKNNVLIVTDKDLYKSEKFNKEILTIFYVEKLHINQKINLDKKKLQIQSLNKIFSYFNTDKAKFYKKIGLTEKSHNYGKFYEKHFKKIKNKKLNILEIGSYRGSSSAAFLNYFQNSKIYCVDINHKIFLFRSKRFKLIEMNYMNKRTIYKFCKKYKNFFDIIIDDGGHYKSHILNNLNNFSDCLKKDNSLYIIEDYGLKFDYLNDLKNEPSIFNVIKSLRKKIVIKSKIFKKNNQIKLIKGINKIYTYKGDWIKYNKNISDICFIEINNIKN
jgi:hypothetical protein